MANILFVDDVPEITQLYATVLTKKGHQVIVANSLMQAIMAINNNSFDYDYVFMDIKMPDQDGFEVLKKADLEANHPKTKVIILSNSESPDDFNKAKAMGAEKYLVKVENDPYAIAKMIEDGKI